MPIEKLNPLHYMRAADYTGFWQKLFATVLYGFWGRFFFISLVLSPSGSGCGRETRRWPQSASSWRRSSLMVAAL